MPTDILAPDLLAGGLQNLLLNGGILARDMRKRPTIGVTSETDFSLADAKKLISDLQDDVLRLEAELFGTGTFLLGPPPVKPGMGRKDELEQEELLKRQDALSRWIEEDW